LFEGLREVRSRCDAAVEGLAAAKEALLSGFDAWASQQQKLAAAGPQVGGVPG
jgi:hypothetical protein